MQTAFVVLILPGVAQRLLVLRALPLRRVGYLQRRAIQIGLIPIRRAAVARLLQRRQRARRIVI
ncbi:hypothetical protein SL267_22250 [Serratia marcescens]|nr:hypothetical protein SL267_22250 [Serratia marcescens]